MTRLTTALRLELTLQVRQRFLHAAIFSGLIWLSVLLPMPHGLRRAAEPYILLGDVSIIKLFTAGFIPGILLAMCFSAWIMAHTTIRPQLVPESEREFARATTAERLASIRELGPAVFLILCVLGSMYGGFATPSESAAVGVAGALIIAALQRSLSVIALKDIAIGAVLTCSMIAMILLGAFILGVSLAFLGIPAAIAAWVKSLGLSPFMLILVLITFYLVLGCFHSALRGKEYQTSRYLAGLRNPGIQILGHPQTRVWNRREGLKANWSAVFAEAARIRHPAAGELLAVLLAQPTQRRPHLAHLARHDGRVVLEPLLLCRR